MDNEKKIIATIAAIRAFSLEISKNLKDIAELPQIERGTRAPDVVDFFKKRLEIYAKILPDIMQVNLCVSSIYKDVDIETQNTLDDTVKRLKGVADRFLSFAEMCRDFSVNFSAAVTNTEEH